MGSDNIVELGIGKVIAGDLVDERTDQVCVVETRNDDMKFKKHVRLL